MHKKKRLIIMSEKINGTAEDISKLPYIGEFLKDFPSEGNVNYAFFKHSYTYWGVKGLFSGRVELEPLLSFCLSHEWTGSSPDVKEWQKKQKTYGVKASEFPVATSPDDYEIYCKITTDGKYSIFITISYRLEDEMFTGELWIPRRYAKNYELIK